MRYYDCIIIGAGAAGLMCAATAAKRGKTVALLDHANKVGKKILMSGGGRCNFTNYFIEPGNYISANNHFCKSALSRYTQYDFLALVQKYNLEYHEKTLGQLFCNHKAGDILQILLSECDAAGVEIHTHCQVDSLISADAPGNARFKLTTSLGEWACHTLVVATGGLSIPTMGATGFGYDIAKQFGLRVTPRHAALVPFTLKDQLLALAQSLAGVSLPVRVHCGQQSFMEALLFTHKGLSGPAILQISNYWYPGEEIVIDFLPNEDLGQLILQWQAQGSKAEFKNLLAQHLPKRFVTAWLEAQGLEALLAGKPLSQFSKKDIEAVVAAFQHWRCLPAGTEGYKTAEVTRGGVNTDDVSSKTFEAKKTPGLFFIGEVLDVTGWLGGFNFQWAWSSGWCAAHYV